MTTPNPGGKHPTLGTTPAHETSWHDATGADLRAHSDPGQVHAAKPPLSNLLLPRSPLIGRDHELAAVQQLLLQEEVGLLTLTGPGGIGKTRLALQVAANLLDHFVDGVYFVSLAPISEPDLVCAAIVQTLGVREAPGQALQESLQAYLRDRQLLLVLDNFEQIVAAAPLVSALLAECRRLKVMVTSRATLYLYGEYEFAVPPLALPMLDPPVIVARPNSPNPIAKIDVETLARYAAIELFRQRAIAAKSDFALTPTNAAAVAAICIGLDGLPLAIELAAARIKLFPPLALLARLQQRLPLLTGGPQDAPARQRTLRDEIAWSYDLLTAAEQTLFRRLAVLVGGFTLEAAQAVGDANDDLGGAVLDGVAALVDQNLLKRMETSDGGSRFGMLETIREYGLEQLAASGEGEAIRRQHISFFLTLAEEADLKLRGAEQLAWLQRLDTDYANLQGALAWSLRDEGWVDNCDRQQGLRLTGALSWFWNLRSRFGDGRAWCERALALSGIADQGPARARALCGVGLTAQMQADFAYARTRFEESLALWRELEDQQGIAFTLACLARQADMLDEKATARSPAEASLVLYREIKDSWGIAFALKILGAVHKNMGDYATARSLTEASLVLYRETGDAWGITDALSYLGEIAVQQRDYTAAQAWLEEALEIGQRVGNKWFLGTVHFFLGAIACQQDKDERAAALFEQSLTLAREIGDKWGIPMACLQLGFIRQRRGDDQQAMMYFRESLENLALLHRPWLQGIILALTGFAAVAAGQQQQERAARLYGVAEVLYAKLDHPPTPLEQADYDYNTAEVRARRSEPQVATAWTQGAAMTLEEAIAYALATSQAPAAPPSASKDSPVVLSLPTYPAGLTEREVEVLRLLAQGLTYAQIAEKLIITRRTVNGHVTSIYNKLGVNGRAAATRFAVEHHLL